MKKIWKKAAALALGLFVAAGTLWMPASASNAVYAPDVRDDTDTVYIGFCNGAEENNVGAYKFPLYVTPKDYVDNSFGADYPTTTQVNDLAYNGATVVYCMDANKAEPNKLVNATEDGRGQFQQMLDITTPATYTEACTTKSNKFNEEETMRGLAYLAKYGYPNGDASFQGTLTDAEYRAVTQWVVYYYTRGYYGTPYANLFGGLNAAQQEVAKRFQIDAIKAAEPDMDVAATLQQYALIFKPLNRATTGDYQYLFGMRTSVPNAVTKFTIRIEKINIAGEELPDATFNLTNLDTMELVEKWTFDGTCVSFDLVPGNYELEELDAPPGYQSLGEKVLFNLDENGIITVDAFNGTGDAYVSNDDMITLLNLEEDAQGGNNGNGDDSSKANNDDSSKANNDDSSKANNDDSSKANNDDSSKANNDDSSKGNNTDNSSKVNNTDDSSNTNNNSVSGGNRDQSSSNANGNNNGNSNANSNTNGNSNANGNSNGNTSGNGSNGAGTSNTSGASGNKTAPKTGESSKVVWGVLLMVSLAGAAGLLKYRKERTE